MLLKIILKKVILYFLASLGYCIFLPLWRKKKHQILILRYHSVSDFRKHEVNVKSDAFKCQMEFLAKNFKVITLKRAVDILKNNEELPENALVVTFDDGYADNYTNAYPILRDLEIPATIFLTAGYIGTKKILPHDTYDNPAYNYLLSWDEARKMSHDGIEFGSHTMTHVNLGKPGIDIESQILDSKKIIENRLNSPVFAISYPFGLVKDFTEMAKNISQRAGYACGCSAMNGVNDPETDIFALKRIGIEGSDNMFTFKAKINGALDLLEIKDRPMFNRFLNRFNRLIGV